MKKIALAMAVLAAALPFVSCTKEPESNGLLSSGENQTVISASTESALTKTALSGNDEEGYDVVWSEGDVIMISGNEYTLTSGAGTTNGTFAGPEISQTARFAWYAMTDKVNWTLPSTQTYTADRIANAPMQANLSLTDGVVEPLEFKNVCGLLRITLRDGESNKVSSITVSATEALCGHFSVANAAAYITTSPEYSLTLDCGEDGVQLTPEGKDFYISLPQGSYSNFTITVKGVNGKSFHKTLKSGKTLDIERAKITTASLSAAFPPENALPGVFSVSEDKKVFFAKGNLTYDTRTPKNPWGFYENQYDYATEYDSEIISFFTWGYGDSWTPEPDTDDYYIDPVETETGMDMDGENFKQYQDWGLYYSLYNKLEINWYTLSKDEWQYLLDNHAYRWIEVCGVDGFAFAPDGMSEDSIGYGYETDVEWKEAEETGILFLPFAGYRLGDKVPDVGAKFYYWTSTFGVQRYSYCLGNCYTDKLIQLDRSIGLPVRLVTDVQ